MASAAQSWPCTLTTVPQGNLSIHLTVKYHKG